MKLLRAVIRFKNITKFVSEGDNYSITTRIFEKGRATS
jgi:hypothetical protein